MAGAVWVTVPDELGDTLLDDDFAEPTRGADLATIADLVCTAAGFAANVVVVVSGRADITAFARRLRDWMTRRTPAEPGAEFVLDAVYRNGSDETRIRIEARRADRDRPPVIDTAALESLLDSMINHRPTD